VTRQGEGVEALFFNVTSSHPKSVRVRAIAHVVVETETIATLFNQR
jgi:hypothetical protein